MLGTLSVDGAAPRKIVGWIEPGKRRKITGEVRLVEEVVVVRNRRPAGWLGDVDAVKRVMKTREPRQFLRRATDQSIEQRDEVLVTHRNIGAKLADRAAAMSL